MDKYLFGLTLRLLNQPGAETWLEWARVDPLESSQTLSTIGNIYLRKGLTVEAELVFDEGVRSGH